MHETAAEATAEGAVPENGAQYTVVRNHEDQYSVWRIGQPVPQGWQEVGEAVSREEALARIEEAWLDLCPLSLRSAR
ncbi:MbtH family NRPS accessory protein [Streptomyces sp. C10-9-1]|uniref:MbtH family protein n=1 Tax=Streptomyces sp. C10-9-1 TaxID=1859285 RepID=UPI00211119A2|nr:MbtH family NRPS accessory protein [Streptomyces sp. C10-9-1]MCQ6555751.1 MbtH family NRPS accessory protein [Streptomyces sp. C10-9-1]